ncbi:hypothetical protein CEXT_381221 [Caerostris extrusa]|uniref:Uncharacterized protein n=1 Tax=Caerostris extrusa TaxID=172846 RepID=A0AAV4WT14_CAEEX|nr:hypothetical protein CEXT_381221 [Caerostris extrusa]
MRNRFRWMGSGGCTQLFIISFCLPLHTHMFCNSIGNDANGNDSSNALMGPHPSFAAPVSKTSALLSKDFRPSNRYVQGVSAYTVIVLGRSSKGERKKERQVDLSISSKGTSKMYFSFLRVAKKSLAFCPLKESLNDFEPFQFVTTPILRVTMEVYFIRLRGEGGYRSLNVVLDQKCPKTTFEKEKYRRVLSYFNKLSFCF